MRIFVFMSLEMHFQIAFGGETIATNVALVGPLPGVGTEVNLQSAVVAKDFAAKLALVFEEGLLLARFTFRDAHVCYFPFPFL